MRRDEIRVGVVGCGFVSQLYGSTAVNHHDTFVIHGCYDLQPERAARFAKRYGCKVYDDFQQMLDDDALSIVVNLTHPAHHFEIGLQVLRSGKHLYSEKPLAMSYANARDLMALAQENRLLVGSAPCNMLTEAFLALVSALDRQEIGKISLARMKLVGVRVDLVDIFAVENCLGVPWPCESEFREVGCTWEHAAYLVALAVELFGTVTAVKSIGCLVAPERQVGANEFVDIHKNDFHMSILEFENGVKCAIELGDVGDETECYLEVVGDQGKLVLENVWDYHSKVMLHKGLVNCRESVSEVPYEKSSFVREYVFNMDNCRGVANLVHAMHGRCALAYSMEQQVHVTEVVGKIVEDADGSCVSTALPSSPTSLQQAVEYACGKAKPVVWGVVGSDTAKSRFQEAIRALPGCALARASQAGSRPGEHAGPPGPGPAYGEDFEAAISDPAVAAIYLEAPIGLEDSYVSRAMAAGKHLLCDSPTFTGSPAAGSAAAASLESDVLVAQNTFWPHCWYHKLNMDRLDSAVRKRGSVREIRSTLLVPPALVPDYLGAAPGRREVGDLDQALACLAMYPIALGLVVNQRRSPREHSVARTGERLVGRMEWEDCTLSFEVGVTPEDLAQTNIYTFNNGSSLDLGDVFISGDALSQQSEVINNINSFIRFGPELGAWYCSPTAFLGELTLGCYKVLDGFLATKRTLQQ